MSNAQDRNFDELAERFSQRVYGGLKGEIRLAVLWADLEPVLADLMKDRTAPLRILDVGGGLGQLALRLAQQGHWVTVNDLSSVMLAGARERAQKAGLEQAITWNCGPYQDLAGTVHETFDLVLCHALLEWLQAPHLLIPALVPLLGPAGVLSLCFYNPASIVYRNLIRGNFNWLENAHTYTADDGSLTPNHPCSIEQVRSWLAQSGFHIKSASGLRVFSDYVVEKRGGHQLPDQVLAMELQFSRQEPYKWLGRYLHIVAEKAN